MNTSSFIAPVAGFIVVILGLTIGGSSVGMVLHAYRSHHGFMATKATVIKNTKQKNFFMRFYCLPFFRPTFAYEVENRHYEKESRYLSGRTESGEGPETFEPGRIVDIYYNPQNPAEAEIAIDKASINGAILTTLFGGALIAFGLFLFIFSVEKLSI